MKSHKTQTWHSHTTAIGPTLVMHNIVKQLAGDWLNDPHVNVNKKFVWVVVKTPRILTTHLSVDPNSKYCFMHHALCTIMHHVLIADYACELYIIHYSSCIIHYAQTFRPLLRIVFGMQPCVKPNI